MSISFSRSAVPNGADGPFGSIRRCIRGTGGGGTGPVSICVLEQEVELKGLLVVKGAE